MWRHGWHPLFLIVSTTLTFSISIGTARGEDKPRCAAPSPQSIADAVDQREECRCEVPSCLGICRLDPERGVFALGQPHQFTPPPSGWSVVVPPIPPPPAKREEGERPKPIPPRPFRPLFYDNDFRYLDDPENTVVDPFDFLKRAPIGPEGRIKVDAGGEFRWQYKFEDNRRLDGGENGFNLFRERAYLDVGYDGLFRVFVEGIWADGSRQTQPPLPTDLNHGDLLNAFGEVRLFSEDGRTLSARYGRQELFFGNQRLVSPLDWVNTRRTFDEVARLVYRSKSWDIDGFWGRPVVPDAPRFDHGDQSRQFFGAYGVYKGIADHTIDTYYLGLIESDPVFRGRDTALGGFDVHTLGGRFQGSRNDWLYEAEAAYQFGDQADLTRSAGMATGGVGRRFSKRWAKPELWFYYDFASGDGDPDNASFGTFNQLFPLGHKYYGYLDIVGRQNSQDANVILTFAPSKRVNALVWYHHLTLSSSSDALYNAAGLPTRRNPSGGTDRHIGDEVDLLLNVIINPHADLQFGYSYFWAGGFLKAAGVSDDASFVYSQFVFRF